jgi:hypothetical protein
MHVMTPHLAFPFLPTAVVACLVFAASCAPQPVRSGVGTTTAVAATPLQSALQAVPLPLLRKARNRGYEPKLWFCRGSGSNQECQDRSDLGYRPMVFFCKEQVVTGSMFTAMHCVDTAQLSLTLQQEEAGPHPADFNFAH